MTLTADEMKELDELVEEIKKDIARHCLHADHGNPPNTLRIDCDHPYCIVEEIHES
jgi:hypothetical protein